MAIFENLHQTFFTVARSLAPLLALFLFFQFAYVKLPRQFVVKHLVGFLLAAIGAILFLQGVQVAFFPVGEEIGAAIAGLDHRWIAILLGFLLGYALTFGEPSVRVLSDQVEITSGGSIRKHLIIHVTSLGVAVFAGLGMARIVYDFPVYVILAPGYALVLAIVWLSQKNIVSIAIDAGAVATGPIVVTFLLAITLGLASALEGRDPVTDSFGIIGLVFLAPILSILTLGLIVRIKTKKRG